MSDPVRTEPKWYRLGIGDVVLVVLVAGIGQTASAGIIGDPGLGWHVRTPDVILERGFPTTDPFSSVDARWLANQWLGDVPLWLGWKAAGLNGIIAVTMAFLLLGYRLLYGFLRADGATWPAAAMWTIAAALASFNAWMARPNLVTFVFVAVLARVLTLVHEGRLPAKRLYWLIPLFAVWANAHGGFVVGLLMLGVAAGVEAVLFVGHAETTDRDAAKSRLRTLILVGIGCFAATLANPYGWKVYPWIFALLGDDYFMNLNQEWLSPDFHAPGLGRVAVFIVLFPALFAVSRHRPKLTLLALSLMWLYLALKGQRYVPLWIVVVTPLLYRAGAQIDLVNARVAKLELDDFFRVRSGGWIGFAAVVIGLGWWAKTKEPIDHEKAIYPADGLRLVIAKRQPGEVVWHGPDFGGFLTWHAWPGLPVWMDDRNDVFGRAMYEAFFDIERTRPGWEAKLAAANPTWVVVNTDRPLTDRLAERPVEWEELHRDALIVVFRKRSK